MEVQGGFFYRHFVLFVLLLAHLLSQLDRYMLAITITPIAQELQFGDKSCIRNSSIPEHGTSTIPCNFKNRTSCEEFTTDWNVTNVCIWDYDGQGLQYQIVAGPVFTVVYTITGIVIGFAGDGLNRKNFLCCCMMFWSASTILTGFINTYWQLVLLRFALGIGEAGCTPFATSLIADYFRKDRRGMALGVYNLGIYMGYSLAFALGNFVTARNILNQGWRWSFITSGCPGILLGCVMIFVVKEPKHTAKHVSRNSKGFNNSSTKSDELRNTVVYQSSKKALPVSRNSTSGQKRLPQPETERTTLAFTNPSYSASYSTNDLSIESDATGNNSHDVRTPADSYSNNLYQSENDTMTSVNVQNSQVKMVFYSGTSGSVVGQSGVSTGQQSRNVSGIRKKLISSLVPFLNPSLVLLVLSGSLRNSAGYVWAYNTQPFFSAIGQTPTEIGAYLSWIPLVGGSVGVVLGGYISDNFVKKRGSEARVLVIVISQLLAAPFAFATLVVSPPTAYFFQIPSYVIGEMWVGVTLTVVIELVPPTSRTAAVAVYLFISTNIGGTVPLLVPTLQTAFLNSGFSKADAFRRTLYVLYPGLVVACAASFLLTVIVMRRYRGRVRSYSNMEIDISAKQT